MSKIVLYEGAAPDTPSTGAGAFYLKTDKGVYLKDDAGLESRILLAGGAITGTTGVFSSTVSVAGLLTVNTSGATLPAVVGGETLRTAGVVGATNRHLLEGFGGVAAITFRRANGTLPSSLSAVQSGDNLAFFSVLGYGATGYNGNISAALFASATENWTDSAIGSKWTIQATANGGTLRATVAEFASGATTLTGTLGLSGMFTMSQAGGARIANPAGSLLMEVENASTFFVRRADSPFTAWFTASATGSAVTGTFGVSGLTTATGGLVIANTTLAVNALGGTATAGNYVTMAPTITAASNIATFADRSTVTMTGGTGQAAKMDLGAAGGITVNTSGAVGRVTTLTLNEPNITVTSGSVTRAATLYVLGAPTEATNNSAIYVASGSTDVQALTATTGTFSSTLGVGAAASPTSVIIADVSVTQTAVTSLRVRNQSTGAGAYAQLVAQADSAQAYLGAVGTGTGTTGVYESDYAYLVGETNAAGLNIGSSAVAGTIRFYAGGATSGSLVGTAAAAGWTLPGTLSVTGLTTMGSITFASKPTITRNAGALASGNQAAVDVFLTVSGNAVTTNAWGTQHATTFSGANAMGGNINFLASTVYTASAGSTSVSCVRSFFGKASGGDTIGTFRHFSAGSSSGVTSGAVTELIGLDVENIGVAAVGTAIGVRVADITGATTMRAAQFSLSSGSGKHNIYANGTAENLLTGITTFGTAAGIVLSVSSSPASGAAGTPGAITWDASYIYVCTASGAWKRAALTGGY